MNRVPNDLGDAPDHSEKPDQTLFLLFPWPERLKSLAKKWAPVLPVCATRCEPRCWDGTGPPGKNRRACALCTGWWQESQVAVASEPEFGISSGTGDIVHQQSHGQQQHGSQSDRESDVGVSQIVNLVSSDDRNQGCGPSGRVERFREVHQGYGEGNRQSGGQPEDLSDGLK